MSEWKELWLKNYKGQGDTAELEKSLKKLGYGARSNISYLPWAVVERIFRLQDGDVHWVPHNENTYVDVDDVQIASTPDIDTGEIITRNVRSYFINITAVWNGRQYTERYPLQDSNGRPLSNWTQNDLNKAFQRGKVKAIAIVSGIGYKLFEDGDLQFEEEVKKEVVDQTIKKEVKETKKEVVKETPKKIDPKPEAATWDRNEIEQNIKREFLKGDEKAKIIKQFLVDKEVKKVNELTDFQVKELYIAVQ